MPRRARARPAPSMLPSSAALALAGSDQPAQDGSDLPTNEGSDHPSDQLTQASPGGSDGEEDLPTPNTAGPSNANRIPIEVAAAAAEMVPEVFLRPPSDKHVAPVSLFTPSRSVAFARPLSEGSGTAPSAIRQKRRRKQVSPPETSPFPGGSGLTFKLPGRTHIPSVLERIVGPPPPSASSAPPHPVAQPESTNGDLLRSLMDAITKSVNGQGEPEKAEPLKKALSAFLPGTETTASLPKAPLDTLHATSFT